MEISRVGPSGLLLDLPSSDAVEAWRAHLWQRRADGDLIAAEIVPGARTVLVDGVTDPDRVARAMREWRPSEIPAVAGSKLVTIPTEYDGPDLAAVADHWAMTPAEIVALHTSTEFRVAFCGFAPGFAYLAGLPMPVPRHATPRTRVPAGSVALADTWCGIYPTPSPGGWQLIGRTDTVLFDVGSEPPALLAPGTRVRFTEIKT